MRQIATLRLTQAAAKYGEHAPAPTACCNACRTCLTTNVLGLVAGAATVVGYRAVRLARRAFFV